MIRIATHIGMLFGLLLALSGCSTLFKVADFPRDTPVFTQYSYDAANRCLRPHIENYFRKTRDHALILVNEIGDRTRNPRDPYSGALSWGGDLVFTSLIRSVAPASHVSLPLARPKEALLFFAGQPLGRLDVARLQDTYHANRILGISGGFTSFDQSRGSDGGAIGGSYRRNDLDLRLEVGKTTEGGRINLVLMIGDVVSNQLLGSVRISGNAGRYADTFKGTLEVNGIGGGLSTSTVVLDGVHSVQENLVAAAHFYMWASLLPGTAEDDCLYGNDTSPAVIAARMQGFQSASDGDQIKMLQQALNAYFGSSQKPIGITGELDQATKRAINAAERRLGTFPHSRGGYIALYHRLISSPQPI